MMRPKTSDIWQYFLTINSDFAQCKICGNKYSRRGRTTTSLRAHLRAMHRDIYEENTNVEQSLKAMLQQPSSNTILEQAEKHLSLAETWHKKKYDELCKIQAQQLNMKMEQPWSDASTTLQQAYGPQFSEEYTHNETYSEQLCNIEVKKENVEFECLDATTMEEPSENNQKWDIVDPKSNKMDDMIGEMIALQNLPCHFVEGVGFRRLMKAALPNYQLRDAQFFSNNICNVIYYKVGNKVGLMLKKCLKLSFTADVLSEPSGNVSNLNLTAHGICEDFSPVKIVLKCYLLEGQNTDMISENFKTTLRDWHIPAERLHCFVRDRSNMVKPMHLTSVSYVTCPIHQLELCVSSALESLVLKGLIEKCKIISDHFHNSQTSQERVVLDCDNRWNSTLYMIERLLNTKDNISVYTRKQNIPQISPEEWLLLNKIIAMLSPFEEVTKSLGDKKTCISSVIPMIYALKHTLLIEKDKASTNKDFKPIIKKLVEDINIRFGDLHTNTLYSLATYLDPRYKLKFFNEIVQEQVQSKLLCLLAQHDIETCKGATQINVAQCTAKKPRIELCPGTSIQDSYTQSVESNLADILNSSDDDQEIDNNCIDNNKCMQWKFLIKEYNNEKRLQIDGDPLLWWRYNTKYKDLAPIVRNYLSPPASSVNGQLLNGEGAIHEPLRNGLNDDKSSKLLFVKYNLPFLNFDY